jgi:hypothetical protein
MHNRSCRRYLQLLLLALSALSWSVEPLVVRMPTLPGRQLPHTVYILTLLEAALAGSGLRLEQVPTDMYQGRAIEAMQQAGGRLDLIWTMTSDEREQALLPIRIPIDRGLLGWRVSLMRADSVGRMGGVTDLQSLARLRAGQGEDWPDTAILRANGIPVEATPSYEQLFPMLEGGRFDHFPRSVIEIGGEAAAFPQDAPLAIEPRLLLRYPTALYFFVSPSRPELAATLANGLEAAVADGRAARLFRRHILPLLRTLDLPGRRVITLVNPLIAAERLPLQRPELWFQLAELE